MPPIVLIEDATKMLTPPNRRRARLSRASSIDLMGYCVTSEQ